MSKTKLQKAEAVRTIHVCMEHRLRQAFAHNRLRTNSELVELLRDTKALDAAIAKLMATGELVLVGNCPRVYEYRG